MKRWYQKGLNSCIRFAIPAILLCLFLNPECFAGSAEPSTKSAFSKSTTHNIVFDLVNNIEKYNDTIPKRKTHSPKKAAIFSAVVPGLGQFYNKKYWKIGILAVGGAGLAYSTRFNDKNYRIFRNELITRENEPGSGNPDLSKYNNADLSELKGYYKRNRDLSVIGIFLLYAANIIDAAVDAHLFDFNVNDNLSLKIQPKTNVTVHGFLESGLSLELNF